MRAIQKRKSFEIKSISPPESSYYLIGKKTYLRDDNYWLLKMLIVIIPLLFGGLYLNAEEVASEQCGRLFPDTWVCPNRNCKYENYVGINYCGICGTWRYAKPCTAGVKESLPTDSLPTYVKRIHYQGHYYLIFNEKAVVHDPNCTCCDIWHLIQQDDGYLMTRYRPWEMD
jgi:hypothetical protein